MSGVYLRAEFPHGVKYSLVLIHNNKRIVGYNNERGKGDNKHYFDKELKYNFVNVRQLIEDFEMDLKKIQEALYGNQEN